MPQAVPVRVSDNGQVPDQFQQKDAPQYRTTQQGEILQQPTTEQLQNEISQMQGQINQLQHQLQQAQHPVSPQFPGSPQIPHQVPRGPQSQLQYQQVPHSPQFPQTAVSQSLYRNVIEQNYQRQQPLMSQQTHLQPPQQPQHTLSNGEQTVRQDAMMRYLMDSLNQGTHIGHYGLLTFAIVAHHFMTEQEVLEYLLKDPSMDMTQAQNLYRQVQTRDYNPPRREKILEWQSHQQFPIIPNTDDVDFGNVYKDLNFPEHVYAQINEYYTHPHNQSPTK